MIRANVQFFNVATPSPNALWSGPFATSSPPFVEALRQEGVELVAEGGDVYLVDTDTVDNGEALPPDGARRVLFHFRDQIALLSNTVRAYANAPETVAIVKHSVYRDPELENVRHGMGGSLYGREFEPLRPDDEDWVEAIYAEKCFPFCLWHWSPLLPWLDDETPIRYSTRPIDAIFVGCESHYWNIGARLHRSKWRLALANLANRMVVCVGSGSVVVDTRRTVFGPMPSPHDHYELLKLSKVAVCPHGYTERSTRSIEASFAGAAIVAPLSSRAVSSEGWLTPETVAYADDSLPDEDFEDALFDAICRATVGFDVPDVRRKCRELRRRIDVPAKAIANILRWGLGK